jgi:hypothetical protein
MYSCLQCSSHNMGHVIDRVRGQRVITCTRATNVPPTLHNILGEHLMDGQIQSDVHLFRQVTYSAIPLKCNAIAEYVTRPNKWNITDTALYCSAKMRSRWGQASRLLGEPSLACIVIGRVWISMYTLQSWILYRIIMSPHPSPVPIWFYTGVLLVLLEAGFSTLAVMHPEVGVGWGEWGVVP